MIKLTRASAGSGKTYTLAKEYLHLLLKAQDAYAFKHILAVTFTNKATSEMKQRILKELNILATSPESSSYIEEFSAEFIPSAYPDMEALKRASRRILCAILHDYGGFAISTIDAFFQQVLRSFSKEIGQFASYQLELDRQPLLQETVDRVLDGLGEADKSILNWLTDRSMEILETGKKLSLPSSLLEIANRLKTEEFSKLASSLGDEDPFSMDKLKAVRKKCREEERAFLASVAKAANEVIVAFEAAGVPLSDTKKSPNICGAIENLAQVDKTADLTIPTAAVFNAVENPQNWFNAKNAKKYLPLVTDRMTDAMSELFSLFREELKLYNTAILLRKQLYGLGVSAAILDEYDKLVREKNVLGIDDSTAILRDIIDGSDTPFVYEKTGVWYEHFLLDEFQDTSNVQWANFEPLLKESVANDNFNLIVGDVKQSIYRWRDSDWELLEGKVAQSFPSQVIPDTLDTNYRSLANIINFNNDMFRLLPEILDKKIGVENSLTAIYKDVKQEVPSRGKEGGLATICFTEKQDERVLAYVKEALEKGYSYKDIAVIVRTNDKGENIASSLLAAGVPVVTDDSLKIASSMSVKRLTAMLKTIDNPGDNVSAHFMKSLNLQLPSQYDSLEDLCERLTRILREIDASQFENDIAYVQSFMDVVHDFSSRHGNTLHQFLDEWKDNKSSLSCPDSSDSVRIITVHKSKGLDFPYVIIPYLNSIKLFRNTDKWCHPDLSGSALSDMPDLVYDITLKQSSSDTCFDKDYERERFLQYVDNLNLLYVANTRAARCLRLLSAPPSDKYVKSFSNDSNNVENLNDLSALLYWYVHKTELPVRIDNQEEMMEYVFGEDAGNVSKAVSASKSIDLPQHYPSWPLNPELRQYDENGELIDVTQQGRLKFSTSGLDYFAEGVYAGASASNRIRGIVMHDILAATVLPSDLDSAVNEALCAGELSAGEASEVLDLLRERIRSAGKRGWFPQDRDKVVNEISIYDTDGKVYRPDRVIDDGSKVLIIDYKFGEENPKYMRQIRKYADLWRRMGRTEVKAALWYVSEDRVVELSSD